MHSPTRPSDQSVHARILGSSVHTRACELSSQGRIRRPIFNCLRTSFPSREEHHPTCPLTRQYIRLWGLKSSSYIAGVLEGKPSLNVYIYSRNQSQKQRRLERADVALAAHQIPALKLGSREALALVNGTSVSAAVAALASHEVLLLASLAHILTAMSVEALHGTDESFHPYFAQVRPHSGQTESASAISSFLHGSSLVWRNHSSAEASLRQDRYSIRTAAQWIGPCIEDLLLAHDQVTVELNSATDNPLVAASSTIDHQPRILHGGNFQAKSITSAVEKIRQAAQSIGRMLFTQCTEFINPATSRGLPRTWSWLSLVKTSYSRVRIF